MEHDGMINVSKTESAKTIEKWRQNPARLEVVCARSASTLVLASELKCVCAWKFAKALRLNQHGAHACAKMTPSSCKHVDARLLTP